MRDKKLFFLVFKFFADDQEARKVVFLLSTFTVLTALTLT